LTELTQYLNITSVIIQIILFITFIILVVALIRVLRKLILKVDDLQRDVNKYKDKVEPLIDDTHEAIKRVNNISDKIENGVDSVNDAISNVKDVVNNVVEFEQRIQRKIEPPVFDTINTYIAIIKGIKTFIEKIKSGRESVSELSEELDSDFYDDEIREEYNDINKELNDVRKKLEEMKKG